MAELGQTGDPRALIPGDPAAVEENASRLIDHSARTSEAGDGLSGIDAGDWHGQAADAFKHTFSFEPAKWYTASDAFADALVTMNDYAGTLRWAQTQAQEAIQQWNAGVAASKAAIDLHNNAVAAADGANLLSLAAGNPPTATVGALADPGIEMRAAARDLLERARAQLLEAGDRSAAALTSAAEQAPTKPRSGWDNVGEFFGGAWDGVKSTVSTLASLSPNRAMFDPIGYGQDLSTMAQGISQGVQHPGDFGKALIDYDTWKSNPSRAAGRFLPDVLLAAATAGSGGAASVASKAASRSATAATALTHTAGATQQMAVPPGAPQDSRPMSGPVFFTPRPGATPAEIEQTRRYVDGCNRALSEGRLSTTGRVSTKGRLGDEATRAARRERTRAELAGTPYPPGMAAGHVPDTSWTGDPDNPEWQALAYKTNSSLAGQNNGYRVGYKPTIFVYEDHPRPR
jgi:hypothetical protein